MKKFAAQACIMLCLLLFHNPMIAQILDDPITNIYNVGGSPEFFISYSTDGNNFSDNGILKVEEGLNNITKVEDAFQFKFLDLRKTASASGDFNGDGIDDVVTIRNNVSGGIKITIPLIGSELFVDGSKEIGLPQGDTLDFTRLRICSGNFDGDLQDEFILCYGAPDKKIRIALYETDENLNIQFIDWYKGNDCFDYHFDIAAGDIDGDRRDEIVLVKNNGPLSEDDNQVNPPIFKSNYNLCILKYDTASNTLINITQDEEGEQNFILGNTAPSGDDWWLGYMAINEMRIACGDLDGDYKDEILVGWSNYYSHYRNRTCAFSVFGACVSWNPYYYHYADRLFLNTFCVLENGEINSVQNISLGGHSFEARGISDMQSMALTLKCTQMDNIGRDEVLLNGSSKIFVLGSKEGGLELEKKTEILPLDGNLNIRGNEAFLVADLDPDTATLNFQKEVVMLLSDKNQIQQMNNEADKPQLQLVMIDTVNSDTIGFANPITPFGFDFDDDNIEVTSFLPGDFDLSGAKTYRIGVPEIFEVSEMQYPLIILNAPPVHFDVFNGTSHDLCNAFLDDGNPEFSAMYYTLKGDVSSTSVEANNSMGFSSELKAYAMAGGSGFENTIRANFESGNSYYKSETEITEIEEEKEVYTEDYVLYSSIDYNYYKYPVYDEDLKMIGHIAILNPKSTEVTYNWGSGNSWKHPGYIFNHEPGNILSYKTFKNCTDFCTDRNAFVPCEFTRVPVTNTGNGSFKFTYENLSSSGSSFSFSGGVGADFFTKVGVEGTATIELGAFGIGGSISSDFRAGVSSELSAFYNRSSLSTHQTELRDCFEIDGIIGRLDESYDNIARYYIKPYIYQSQSGALVLDYMIDLDEELNAWWDDHYGTKPDLAFILPWRYAEEKGNVILDNAIKGKTNEIQFFPGIVHTGDTVCITTRVHNYSLETFNDWLNVEYYLGDPEKDGVKLTDIYGNMGSSKFSTMIYGAEDTNLDFEEYLTFNWQVPDTCTCAPRIYAVIDMENEYEEIHENNNKGWNTLRIYGCADCGYIPDGIEPGGISNASIKLQCYPNPARGNTIIRYELPEEAMVSIEICNISGQVLGLAVNEKHVPGKYEIPFTSSELGSGIYFIRLSAGNVFKTTKLVVLE